MNRSSSEPSPQLNADRNCDQCGRFGALQMGDHWLCEDCLQAGCSCCPEFEQEDIQTNSSSGGLNDQSNCR